MEKVRGAIRKGLSGNMIERCELTSTTAKLEITSLSLHSTGICSDTRCRELSNHLHWASQLTPSQAVDNVGGLGEKVAVMGGNKVG